jgi:N-acylneuraminate cytidylyltransferase
MKILFLIPARAGSKGLPGKNYKLLMKMPLVSYSIDFAINNAKEVDEICVSTDDENVLEISKRAGIKTPFKRPSNLSTDTASTQDVILHALEYYKKSNINFEAVMLLQPTSPFRNIEDFDNVINEFDSTCDMVVTVKEAKENPYFTLFEENTEGFLNKSKIGDFERRQDCPPVYAFNGSIYLIRVTSILSSRISEFKKIKKVVMPNHRSVDIDTMADWVMAEHYAIENK